MALGAGTWIEEGGRRNQKWTKLERVLHPSHGHVPATAQLTRATPSDSIHLLTPSFRPRIPLLTPFPSFIAFRSHGKLLAAWGRKQRRRRVVWDVWNWCLGVAQRMDLCGTVDLRAALRPVRQRAIMTSVAVLNQDSIPHPDLFFFPPTVHHTLADSCKSNLEIYYDAAFCHLPLFIDLTAIRGRDFINEQNSAMPTYKRKPLQPLDPQRRLDRPPTSSRPGVTSTTTAAPSSSVGAVERTPTRLAELHGNAVEERKARCFQDGGKSGKGLTYATAGDASNISGSGNTTLRGVDTPRSVATGTALTKANERDSGKRRRDASPSAYEGMLTAAAPSLPPARKKAKVVHGGIGGSIHEEEECVGSRKIRGTGVGDADEEDEDERDEEDDDEAEADDGDEDEYKEDENEDDESDYDDDDADEDSEYEDSPVRRSKTSPYMSRPNWMPVSMRLQHRLVQQEGVRVEFEAGEYRFRRRSTRSKGGPDVTVVTRSKVEGSGVVVGAGKGGQKVKAALRDSDADDLSDGEVVEEEQENRAQEDDGLADEEDDDDRREDEDGESEYEDEDHSDDEEYEGPPAPHLSGTLTARTRTPVSMRLQQKLVLGGGLPADHNLEIRDNRTRASAIDDREGAAASGVDEEDEEGEDEKEDLSDASEEGSEYSDSSLPQRTTRPRTTSARHGSRGPVSMRLQQKAMLDLEDGLAHNDELRRGRSGNSRSPRRGAAYQVVQGLPTSTRLQEKRLRQRDSVDVDGFQPAIAGTPQHAQQTPGRPPKRVHWQGDSKASGTVSTPLSTRLQAKMVNEMERKGPESVEGGAIRNHVDEEEEDGDEEELTDSEDETWGEGSESDSESQSGSPARVGRGHAWLSGVRTTRATRKTLKEILRPQADVEDVEGEGVGDGCEDGGDVALETPPGEGRREPCSIVDWEKGPVTRNLQTNECRESHSILHPRAAGEHGGEATTFDSKRASKLGALHGCGVEEPSACLNPRRSSRIADLNTQRSPLPNPPYVPRPCTALPRTPSKRKGKTIEVYVDDAEDYTNEADDTLERERQRYQDEVRRMRLGYPPPGRTEAPVVDYNAKDPIDWETSIGKKVAMRMQELGYSVVDF